MRGLGGGVAVRGLPQATIRTRAVIEATRVIGDSLGPLCEGDRLGSSLYDGRDHLIGLLRLGDKCEN